MSRHARPAAVLPTVLAALAADASPLGLTHAQLRVATGLPSKQLSSAVRILKLTARAFSLGKSKDMRVFASAERVEQCRPTWEAFMTELTAARLAHHRAMERMHRNRQYHKQHPEARTKAEVLARVNVPVRPPKPAAKPPRVVKPKKAKQRGPVPLLVGKMQPKRTPRPKDERPVVIPPHVKTQHCPSSKDTRYSVPAGFVGEFSKQWRELRSHTKGQA